MNTIHSSELRDARWGRSIWGARKGPKLRPNPRVRPRPTFWMGNTRRSQTFALRVGAHHFEYPPHPTLFPNLRPKVGPAALPT